MKRIIVLTILLMIFELSYAFCFAQVERVADPSTRRAVAQGFTASPQILLPSIPKRPIEARSLPQQILPRLEGVQLPKISVQIEENGNQKELAVGIQILLLLTVLSLAPAILIMMTSFTRIIVVLSFLRHGLGTQQMPPNQILIGLAMFLTFFIMAPVWQQVNSEALQPYLENKLSQRDAFEKALVPIRNFLLNHTRERDLALMVHLSKMPQPKNPSEIPTHVLVPAFITSELKTAFQMSFLIYLPFLIIDMVIASTLMSMGMMMLPPVMISLPFKLLLFVLADGWHLTVTSLVAGFR